MHSQTTYKDQKKKGRVETPPYKHPMTERHAFCRKCQIRRRRSHFGQIQYIPPGLPSDLITLVATIAVALQVGQYFPVNCTDLSVRLARAVLLNFSAKQLFLLP